MLFNTLALISLLIIIMLLRRLVNIYPSLLACMIRWKENVNLQMSVKLSTDRNLLALSMIIPFCLTVYRFGLYRPEFMAEMDEAAGVGVTIGIFTAYMLTRRLCYIMARPRKASQTMYRTSASASYTFFIILALLLLATGGVLSFFDVNPDMIKTAMIWVSACIYAVFMFRCAQIFASSYNLFIVFLYLCALEIIPTGILVISAIIF